MSDAEDLLAGLDESEQIEELEELLKSAVAADSDSEAMLVELQQVAADKTYWTNGPGKRKYENLRDKVIAVIEGQGVKYFIAKNGAKYVAIPMVSETVEIDEELLQANLESTDYPDDTVLDAVMPRKVDRKAFKRAVARGDITPATFVRVARFKPRAGHVRFVPADDQ